MKYAVVDVETTGFGRTDRVVEVAVVVVDAVSDEVVDEFDTLVNPQRDVGATHVHGITASMVESAPTFEEVSGALARVLGGNVLVAHNLPFEVRFLREEFARAGADFDAGRGACTLRMTRERLDQACLRHDIFLESHHRALADARATAELLGKLDRPQALLPSQFRTDLPVGVPRTLRRDSVGGEVMPISPSRFRVRYPTSDELAASYLHVLDAYLDDLILEERERDDLAHLAALYDILDEDRDLLHEAYVASLISAARRDGIVTVAEHELIGSVCRALGLDASVVPEATATAEVTALDGQRVCFTGTFVVAGVEMSKGKLEAIAAKAGLQPVGDVTKKGCDLLVASDASSSSGKAQKARAFGIPIIGIQEFIGLVESYLT
jgi:DNA polymerase-3 subunit epsilon